MSDDSTDIEAGIIQAAYSDRVKEAFVVFAENLSVGQAEKLCKDRFLRSLLLVKRARDLALEVIGGVGEPPSAESEGPKSAENAADKLSAQD